MRTGDWEIRRHFPGDRLLTLAVLAVLVLVFSVFAKHFFSVKGILNLLVQTCPFTIVGIGSALVLIAGGIDFSLGALVALGGVGVLWFLVFGLPVWASMGTA
ncbi:MAG TPA: hypothetical protein VMM82_00780, partial [Spirochaetia bacterium]|nr:hypothetical protein [Spirochaetia bacterium]